MLLSELVSIEFIFDTSDKGEGGGGGGGGLGFLSVFQGIRFVYERGNASLWPQSRIRDILGNRTKPKIHVQCNLIMMKRPLCVGVTKCPGVYLKVS